MTFKHSGTEVLETERLILRRFSFDDATDMMENWISDHEVQTRYCEPVYQTKEEVQELLEKWISMYSDKYFYRWAIILKEKDMNIGQIAFCRMYKDINCAEVEYCVGQSYWGNGYVAEALREVIKYSFEKIELDKIEGFHMTTNNTSGRVLQKAGMKKAEYIERFDKSNASYDDRVFYACKRDDYLSERR